MGPRTGGLSEAKGLGPFGKWGPPGWPRMWGRGRNRANPGMVPAWGRSSNNRGIGCRSSLSRTHSRTALGSSRGDGSNRGCSSGSGGSGGGRGGGGGGGLNRRVREGERLNPFNIHKWVVSG